MRLLAISGSLRRGSYNTALLHAAKAERPPGVELVFWQGLGEIPAYDEDLSCVPLALKRLADAIARADAVLVATPEYNSSVPGALKNALDWLSRPVGGNVLRLKPTAVVGASQGLFGAVWAQEELRKILRTMGAQVMERGVAVAHAHTAFAADGRLRDAQLAASLRDVVEELARRTRQRAA